MSCELVRLAEVLFLSADDVLRAMPSTKHVIETIADVLKAHGEGRVVLPGKTLVDLKSTHNGHFSALPAYVRTPMSEAAGIKWLSYFYDNPAKYSMPGIMATVILNDPRTGTVMSVMDGSVITGVRTAAVSAVGAKYLARDDSHSVGLIGASVQAGYQLVALAEVFNIKQVHVYDVVEETSKRYIHEMRKKFEFDIMQAPSTREVARRTDIVVTVTRALKPFFHGEWCEPGMLVIAVGSTPELHRDVLQKLDKIVVDTREGCKHMGSLAPFFSERLLTDQAIHAEIGEIVCGKKTAREGNRESMLFAHVGMGTEDIATAYEVYKIASEKGIGQKIRL
jgi:ornithine cyclodeaminase/alanine dehydrogenase-like protein (mu-crystallin family)